MSTKYIVIQQYAWCTDGEVGIEYSSDLIHHDTREEAISHGFNLADSDDFNIGVVEGGRLAAFDWMQKSVGESPETLAKIAEIIGLGELAEWSKNVSMMMDFLQEGRHGWGVDKHGINHFKEHVWFKSCAGGYTECCEYGNECPHHKIIRENIDNGGDKSER